MLGSVVWVIGNGVGVIIVVGIIGCKYIVFFNELFNVGEFRCFKEMFGNFLWIELRVVWICKEFFEIEIIL